MAIVQQNNIVSAPNYARVGISRSGYTTLDSRQKELEYLRQQYNKEQEALKKQQKQQSNFIKANNIYTDYDDPLAINSVADALFNTAGLKKRLGEDIGSIPVVRNLAGLGTMIWDNNFLPLYNSVKYKSADESTLDAIARGTKAGLYNTLVNTGETLDIAANPIKGMFLEDEGVWEGFKKGVGVSDEGRTNYDWDVQPTDNAFVNGAANFGLELVSDPFNWISLGGKQLITSGVKKGTKTLGKELVEELGTQAGKKVTKKTNKLLVKNYLGKVTPEVAENAITKAATKTAVKKTGNQLTKATQQALLNTVDNVIKSKLPTMVAGRALWNTSEGIQKALLKTTLGPSTVGLGYNALKLSKRLLDSKVNKSLQAVNKADLFDFDRLSRRTQEITSGMPTERAQELSLTLKKASIENNKVLAQDVANKLDSTLEALKPYRLEEVHNAVNVFDKATGKMITKVVSAPIEKFRIVSGNADQVLEVVSNSIKGLEDSIKQYTGNTLNTASDYIKYLTDAATVEPKLGTMAKRIEDLYKLRDWAASVKNAIDPEVALSNKVLSLREVLLRVNNAKYANVSLDTRAGIVMDALNDLDAIKNIHGVSKPRLAEAIDDLIADYLDIYNRKLRSHTNLPFVYDLKELNARWADDGYSMVYDVLGAARPMPKVIDKIIEQEGMSKRMRAVIRQISEQPHIDWGTSLKDILSDTSSAQEKNLDAIQKLLLNNKTTKTKSFRIGTKKPTVFGNYNRNDLLDTVHDAHIKIQDMMSAQRKGTIDEFIDSIVFLTPNSSVENFVAEFKNNLHELYSLGPRLGMKDYVYREALQKYENSYDLLEYLLEQNPNRNKALKAITAEDSKYFDIALGSDDVFKALSPDNIMSKLKKLPDVDEATSDMLSVKALTDEVYYSFKLAQNHNTLSFVNLDSVNNLIKQMDTPGSTFNTILDSTDTLGKDIRKSLESFRAYRSLVTDILNADKDILSTDMASSVLDALNSYQRYNTDNIVNYFDEMIAVVKDKAAVNNKQRDSVIKGLGLEDLTAQADYIPKNADGIVEDFANQTGGKAHQAAYDCCINEQLMIDPASKYQSAFMDAVGDTNKYIPIAYDLETNGLSRFTGNITQIGLRCGPRYTQQIDCISETAPVLSVLQKLNFDSVEAFKKVHSAKLNPKALPEGKALLKFVDNVEAIAKETGKTPVLYGHNIHGFDKGQFLARARATLNAEEFSRVARFFATTRDIDTLKIVRAVEDYAELTPEAEAYIRNVIQKYTETLTNTGVEKFIQPMSNKLGKDLYALSENVKKTFKKDLPNLYDFTAEYNEAAKDILDSLKNISETNTVLRQDLYARSDFERMNSNIMHELIKDTHGVQTYSSRKRIDGKLIVDHFDLDRKGIERIPYVYDKAKSNTKLNAERLTSAAQRMQRTMDYVKNFRFLESTENKKAIYELAEKIRDFVDNGVITKSGRTVSVNTILDSYIPYMRIAEDTPLLNYAMIEESMLFLKAHPDVMKAFEDTLPAVTTELLEKYTKQGVSEDFAIMWKTFTDDSLKQSSHNIKQILKAPAYTLSETFADYTQPDSARKFVDFPISLEEASITIDNITASVKQATDKGEALLRAFDNNNLSTTAPLRYNSYRTRLVELFKDVQDYLTGLNPITYKHLRNKVAQLYDTFGENQIKYFTSLRADNLLEYMYNAGGRVAYVSKRGELSNEVASAWKEAGVHTFKKDLTDGNAVYIFVLDKNRYEYCKNKFVSGTLNTLEDVTKYNEAADKLRQVPLVPFTNEVGDKFINTINAFRQSLNEIMPGVGHSTGDYLKYSTLTDIDGWLPDEALKLAIPRETLKTDGFFDTMHYQTALIGPPSKRTVVDIYTAHNPLKEMVSTYLQSMNKLDHTAQYASLYYNDTLSLNKSPIFSAMSDEELFKMVKDHKELSVTALVKDKHTSHGYRAAAIKINSLKDIKIAKKLDAAIMPINTYLDVAKVVNHFSKMPPVFRAINGFITSSYKTGFLGSIGTVFRNLLDGILKNGIDANAPSEIPRALAQWFDTTKLYKKYLDEEVLFDTWRINKHGAASKISKDLFAEYFTDNTVKHIIDKDTFDIVYSFIKEGPSGGLTKQMQDYYASVTKNVKQLQGLDKAIARWNSLLKNTPGIKQIQGINHHVEQTLRLSNYLKALEEGASTPEAMRRVLATHFDYSAKSYTTRMVETLFPFIGFTLKNLDYYADAFLNKGWFAGLFRDFMVPVMRFNEDKDSGIDYQTIKRTTIFEDPLGLSPTNKYIPMSELYHILNGNIQIDTGLDNPDDERKDLMLVFKINPSVMDALNFASNPIDSVSGRLLPILRVAKEVATGEADSPYKKSVTQQVIEAIPVIGTTVQRLTSAQKNLKNTENPVMAIPSLFGVSTDFKEYDPKKEYTNVSERLAKMWYAQYKSGNKSEEYNPSKYFDNKYTPAPQTIKRFISQKYAEYKKKNLPPEMNPYSRYAALVPEDKRAVYEPFDPQRSDRDASESQVKAWYQYYKQNNLPFRNNPYRVYTKYNKFNTKGATKTIASDSVYKNLKRMYNYYPKTYKPYNTLNLVNKLRVQQFYNSYFTSRGKPRSQLSLIGTSPLQAKAAASLYNKLANRYYN